MFCDSRCVGHAGEGINTDAGNEQEALFSLSALRGKGNLAELAEVSAPAEHEMEEYEADSDTNAAWPEGQESDDEADDSDDEDRYASDVNTCPWLQHLVQLQALSVGTKDQR